MKRDLNYIYENEERALLLEEISNEINGILECLKEEPKQRDMIYFKRLVDDFKDVIREVELIPNKILTHK